MKKRGKKGLTQIDWVVSFAIFFAYLVWFFIYIRPTLAPEKSTDALLSEIKDNLVNDASWTVDIVPLLVKSNLTLYDEPVIAKFPFSWGYENTGFNDNKDFYMSEGKIFLIANLTNTSQNMLWIAHSSENYTRQNFSRNFFATRDSLVIDSKQFSASFESSLLSRITFNGNLRLTRFNLSYDGNSILSKDFNATDFNSTPIIAKYSAKTDAFNNSMYVFAENSRIYGFAYSNTFMSHNYTITATLKNYTDYYATENSRGKISINDSCINFSGNYVDLYDSKDGITFITRDLSNGSICGSNTSIILSLTFPLKNESSYTIMMHGGDYRNTTKFANYIKERTGVVEQLKGISLRLINGINKTSYSGLKSNWSYPSDKNFAFFLKNASNSDAAVYQPAAPPDTSNVHVIKFDIYTLDKLGNKKKHTLLIRGW